MIFSVLEKNTLTCCTFLCLDTIPQIFLLFCNWYRLNITNYKDNFTYAFSRTWKTYKFVLFFLMKSYFTYTFQSVWKSIIDVLHLIIKYKFTHIFFCILTKNNFDVPPLFISQLFKLVTNTTFTSHIWMFSSYLCTMALEFKEVQASTICPLSNKIWK